MPRLNHILNFLEDFAPLTAAAEWDNVGLLLGDREAEVSSVMTCLTLTPDVAAEAVARGADLIVTHHPILFRPVQRLTTDTADGRTVWELARQGIAVYSPHTAFDSARDGVNRQLAELFALEDVQPLRPSEDGEGHGRYGRLPTQMTLGALVDVAKSRFSLPTVQFVGDVNQPVVRLGIACGSAAEFLGDAAKAGCEAFLTGEARFHAGLEARSRGVGLILVGHFASERPAVERLADVIRGEFPALTTWASDVETDPIQWR